VELETSIREEPIAVADLVLHREIERTLFREAALLDAHDYRAWMQMLTDDIVYWMPIRQTRGAGDTSQEFTSPGDAALFDENRKTLELRIEKRLSGYSWSEDPPSRTRHCIMNVDILERHGDDEVSVAANIIVYRCRLDTDEDWWVGRRVDRLRRVGGQWKIARRAVYLDQTVLKAKNLSIFF
jgi:3-phenylpropionate/cinnamic acid dioxygenase small subunit